MATEHGAHDSGGHGPINHETTDIHLDGVGKITIGFALFMALVIAAMYGAVAFLDSRESAGQRPVGPMSEPVSTERPAMLSQPNQMEQGGRTPAGPKLLTNEPMNLRAYRAEQSSRLNGYGWVDRANGVVHMPIARAIELTVERGLPVAAAPATDAAASEGATPEGASPGTATPGITAPAPATTPATPTATPPVPSAPRH